MNIRSSSNNKRCNGHVTSRIFSLLYGLYTISLIIIVLLMIYFQVGLYNNNKESIRLVSERVEKTTTKSSSSSSQPAKYEATVAKVEIIIPPEDVAIITNTSTSNILQKQQKEQVCEMTANKDATFKLTNEVVSGQRVLHHPYINLGMPKVGSTTLQQFFKCSDINAMHWTCKTTDSGIQQDYCGRCMMEAYQNKKPLLESCGYGYNNGTGQIGIDEYTEEPVLAAQAFTQLDWFSTDSKHCPIPQISLLKQIHKEHPYATFFWISRPLKAWNKSLKGVQIKDIKINSWQAKHLTDSLRERFTKCDLPGLPSGVGSEDSTLFEWVCNAQQNVRDFVKKYPTHALIELDLMDPNNNNIMTQLFGSKSKKCWGHANKT